MYLTVAASVGCAVLQSTFKALRLAGLSQLQASLSAYAFVASWAVATLIAVARNSQEAFSAAIAVAGFVHGAAKDFSGLSAVGNPKPNMVPEYKLVVSNPVLQANQMSIPRLQACDPRCARS